MTRPGWRRKEEERDALVGEGDGVEQADAHERDHGDEGGPGQIAGDHDRAPIQPVSDHPAHRRGEDRRHEPKDEHHRHGCLVPVGECEGRRDEGEGGNPIAERRDRLADEQAAEPSRRKGRTKPPEGPSRAGAFPLARHRLLVILPSPSPPVRTGMVSSMIKHD